MPVSPPSYHYHRRVYYIPLPSHILLLIVDFNKYDDGEVGPTFDDALYLESALSVVVENMFVDGVDEVAIEGIFVWILLAYTNSNCMSFHLQSTIIQRRFVDDLLYSFHIIIINNICLILWFEDRDFDINLLVLFRFIFLLT